MPGKRNEDHHMGDSMIKLSTTLGALLLVLGLIPLAARAESAPNARK